MRSFFLLAFMLGLASTAMAERPNIVFIMADDLGWKDVSYQDSEIDTPNIDRLRAGGMRFDRYYAYPMCNSTRTALMTGRMPARMTARRRNSVPLDELFLSQVLHAAGYETAALGKWHLGSDHVDYFAHNRGFDHFYGHLSAGIDYFSHIANGALDWQRNGVSVREEGYSTTLLTDEAVQRIEQRDANRPLFLYVAYNAPHAPLQAPQEHIDKYAHIENRSRRTYAAMVDAVDVGVSRIVDAIDAAGIRDNTLIVWVSDNGGSPTADNGLLRGGKTSTYEGGVRVPGLINWSAKIPAGSTLRQQISVHDWLPTLTAAAEIAFTPVKPLDGQNMWPAIARGETVDRKPLMIAHRGNEAVFRGRWKLVRTPRTGSELFDVFADPSEQENLAEQYPDVVTQLVALIDPVTNPAPRIGQGAGGGSSGDGRSALQRSLEQWDANGDGLLVADEVPEALRRIIMRRDADGNGVLTEDELSPSDTGGFGTRFGGGRGGGLFGPQQEETRPPLAEAAARD